MVVVNVDLYCLFGFFCVIWFVIWGIVDWIKLISDCCDFYFSCCCECLLDGDVVFLVGFVFFKGSDWIWVFMGMFYLWEEWIFVLSECFWFLLFYDYVYRKKNFLLWVFDNFLEKCFGLGLFILRLDLRIILVF